MNFIENENIIIIFVTTVIHNDEGSGIYVCVYIYI